jgi:hypothetical protein
MNAALYLTDALNALGVDRVARGAGRLACPARQAEPPAPPDAPERIS